MLNNQFGEKASAFSDLPPAQALPAHTDTARRKMASPDRTLSSQTPYHHLETRLKEHQGEFVLVIIRELHLSENPRPKSFVPAGYDIIERLELGLVTGPRLIHMDRGETIFLPTCRYAATVDPPRSALRMQEGHIPLTGPLRQYALYYTERIRRDSCSIPSHYHDVPGDLYRMEVKVGNEEVSAWFENCKPVCNKETPFLRLFNQMTTLLRPPL